MDLFRYKILSYWILSNTNHSRDYEGSGSWDLLNTYTPEQYTRGSIMR